MALYVDIEKKCGDFCLKVKFEAEKEVFAILGASGCGKSLTLKCIAGIERPDKGVIRLDDRVLFDAQKHINLPTRKRRVGYLFQDYALFPNMTVLQNIMCGTGDKAEAEKLVERFCLTGKEHLYPAQLSGGQKQRVAIARMLGAKPELIMLDEPFSALDNHLKTRLEREIMGMLDSFGKTALFVSHDRNEVYRLTDRIAVMEEGQIVELKLKKELFQNPRTLAGTLLTGCKNITRLERALPGQTGEEAPDGSRGEKPGQTGEDRVTGGWEFWAVDWGIRLRVPETAKDFLAGSLKTLGPDFKRGGEELPCPRYAGFRAHYFQVTDRMEDANVFDCQVLRVIEDTFSVIILFRQRGYEAEGDFGTLTYELPKEKWEQIKDGGLFLKIPANRLIFMDK